MLVRVKMSQQAFLIKVNLRFNRKSDLLKQLPEYISKIIFERPQAYDIFDSLYTFGLNVDIYTSVDIMLCKC